MYKHTFVSVFGALLLLFSVTAFSEAGLSTVNPTKACPALLDHHITTLHTKQKTHLCEHYANKVLLVVNTASQCGFTPQLEGLEELYKTHKDQGFAVLGFPSNDFLQDRGDDKQIATFCRINYGVSFPMFSKSAVRGFDANPFYKSLAERQGQAPWWNFYKYLIDRDGNVVDLYNSQVTPQDPALIKAIESLL